LDRVAVGLQADGLQPVDAEAAPTIGIDRLAWSQ